MARQDSKTARITTLEEENAAAAPGGLPDRLQNFNATFEINDEATVGRIVFQAETLARSLVAHFAAHFRAAGCENYLQYSAYIEGLGRFSVTVQREGRLTPSEKYARLAGALRDRVERLQGGCDGLGGPQVAEAFARSLEETLLELAATTDIEQVTPK